TRKQPRGPSTEEWIRKMWYMYTMEYYAAEKNNDIMKFAGKWMELENVILSEPSVAARKLSLKQPAVIRIYSLNFRCCELSSRGNSMREVRPLRGGLYELLAALPAQLQPHVDSQEDLTFLWDMFGEKSLHSLVKTPLEQKEHLALTPSIGLYYVDQAGPKLGILLPWSLERKLQIHEKLHSYEKQSPVPILHGAAALADDLTEELQNRPLNSETRELLKLLSKPNVK
ncbi:hypothetical protein STEG23_004859, partial [Scotinomys teguina]